MFFICHVTSCHSCCDYVSIDSHSNEIRPIESSSFLYNFSPRRPEAIICVMTLSNLVYRPEGSESMY